MSLRLPCLLALLLVWGSACDASEDAWMQAIEASAGEVSVGEPFRVRVTRAWPIGRSPAEFDESDLAPLSLVLLSREQREENGRVLEVRVYRAQAFALGLLRLRPTPLHSGGGAGDRTPRAQTDPLEVRVRALLAADDGSKPEPPADLAALARQPWWPWLALLLLLPAAWLLRQRRTSPTRALGRVAHGATLSPQARARQALDELAEDLERNPTRAAEIVCGVADVLRTWLQAALDLPVLQRTTHETRVELARSPKEAGGLDAAALLEVLSAADLLKFGSGATGASEAEAALSTARGVLSGAQGSGEA